MKYSTPLQHIVKLIAVVLILKVTASILSNYPDYLPPNFDATFLHGRQGYFWNGYQWAFFVHIFASPCALLVGLLLMSERFRSRFLRWHRYLGRFNVASILLLVSPSGIWMSFYAETGAIAGFGFASLGVVTSVCALLGWRSAVSGRIAQHRRWMTRCFLLLCSAVVLRLIGGAATVANIEGEWVYALAAWLSWLVPLAIYTAAEHAPSPACGKGPG